MEILSVNNARVKQWAQLLQKKGRDRQGKFIAEGIHLVKEALRTNFPIECIVYDIEQGWPETVPRPNGLECIAVSSAIIKKCTDAVTPQPIFAIMPMLTWSGPSMQTKQDGLVVAIDGIQDPGNLGTLIRSADAVAADAVWVQIGGADLYNPKTVRASMGSIFHLPVVPMDLTSRLSRLQVDHEQMRIVGSLLGAEQTCYEFDFTGPCCLVIGNEAKGISPDVYSLLTDQVHIPMPGKAESLNAAMAASVLLFEALRQRRYS